MGLAFVAVPVAVTEAVAVAAPAAHSIASEIMSNVFQQRLWLFLGAFRVIVIALQPRSGPDPAPTRPQNNPNARHILTCVLYVVGRVWSGICRPLYGGVCLESEWKWKSLAMSSAVMRI